MKVVQLCQFSKQKGHARATQWVSLSWEGYAGAVMSKIVAYCDKCAFEDSRVAFVERIEQVK